MKRVLTILLLVSFVMALAPPCHAAGYGEIAISLVDVPAELQERSVLITLGSGPNDTDTILVVLNGLNQYCQTVTLSEGIYYCNAAVQYDALNDWPLHQPPADYQPTTVQVSAYLTAPAGFSQHCIVYLQNLYSGTVYALDVYESNQLAAVCTEADSGPYTFLSARVVGDAAERYQFECEQKELNTDDGASFHLTVTDTKNPDADLSTPSHDENTTVQRAAAYNAPAAAAPSATPTPEPTSSQPVQQSQKPANPFWNVLDFLPIVFIGVGLFWFCQKNRRGGPKG